MDVVRVVTRFVGRRLRTWIKRPIKGFPNRRRAARRRMLAIQRMTTTQRHAQQTGNIASSSALPRRSWNARDRRLRIQGTRVCKDFLLSDFAAEEPRKCRDRAAAGLGDRVIDQARRRVLEGGASSQRRRKSIPSLNSHTGSDQAREGANCRSSSATRSSSRRERPGPDQPSR